MKKSFFIGILTILAGCMSAKHKVEFAGDDFNHTGSMCMDALLVNMDRGFCTSPEITPTNGSVFIQCKDSNESFWNSNVFVLVPGMQVINYETYPICMDFNYALFLYAPVNNQEK